MRTPIAASPRWISMPDPKSRCTPWGPRSRKASCGVWCPFLKSTPWTNPCCSKASATCGTTFNRKVISTPKSNSNRSASSTIRHPSTDRKSTRSPPQSVDESLLLEGERNLRDYFQSQVYFDAEVEFKPQRVVNDKASIDFLINPGKRHKLVLIGIQGNKYFRTEAIRERMFLMRASLVQFRRGRYSGALLRRDEQSIGSLYQSNGFRDVAVTHKLVAL